MPTCVCTSCEDTKLETAKENARIVGVINSGSFVYAKIAVRHIIAHLSQHIPPHRITGQLILEYLDALMNAREDSERVDEDEDNVTYQLTSKGRESAA